MERKENRIGGKRIVNGRKEKITKTKMIGNRRKGR